MGIKNEIASLLFCQKRTLFRRFYLVSVYHFIAKIYFEIFAEMREPFTTAFTTYTPDDLA